MHRLLLFLILLGFSSLLIAQDRIAIKSEIDKIIHHDTEITLEKTPGFLIALIKGDSTFIYSYGSAERNGTQPLTADNIFELGGVSKVFTAQIIEHLVDQNKLKYQSYLNDLLPDDFKNKRCDSITILDLITHTSGLPRMPTEFGVKELEDNNPYKHYSKNDLLGFYKNFELLPSEEYLYSNVNYALLEIVIEKITGQTFSEVLQELILVPLGMDQTFISIIDSSLHENLSTGYSISKKAVNNWEFQSFAASEGIKSNITNLVSFVKLNISSTPESDPYLMDKLHKKLVPTPLDPEIFAAKGWHILTHKKYYDVIIHSGTTSGHRAFIGFVKENQSGVIILSNSEYGMGGLGFLILGMINNHWRKPK